MPSMTVAPGKILNDRFCITGILGEGAYGVIFSANDLTAAGARWAVKETRDAALTDEERSEMLDLFTREVTVLQGLNHTGVPKVVDSFSLADRHYIVMELIEGETLQEIARRGPSILEILAWGARLGEILDYLHHQEPPVIFRDLKPANVMITPRGRVVLIDFGIARLYNPEKSRDTYLLGTPGFCAPEQYGRGQSTVRSDVYSLCATLYFLACRRDLDQFGCAIPPLSRFVPHAPPAFVRLLEKGLEPEPGKRHGDMQELRRELLRAGEEIKKSLAQGAPARQGGSLPHIGWLWLILLFAMAIQPSLPLGIFIPSLAFLVIPLYTMACYLHGPTRRAQAFPLVVSFIIMILGGLLLPNFLRFRSQASLSPCPSHLKNLGTALEMYSSDNHGRYPESLSQLTPTCLKSLPACQPSSGNRYYGNEAHFFIQWEKEDPPCTYGYAMSRCPDAYTLWCTARMRTQNHGGAGFPQYNSVWGLIENEKSLDDYDRMENPGSPARLATCRGNVTLISKALKKYAIDHEGNYPSSLQQLAPFYCVQVPGCPSLCVNGSPYDYKTSSSGKKCRLSCPRSYHLNSSGVEVHPFFESGRGVSE